MTEKRILRLVMISANFYPYIGGAERQALELSKALQDMGVSVTVLTRHRQGLAADETIGGISVHRLAAYGSGIINSFGFMISIFSWLWAHSFEWDVAHVHLASSHALPAALAGKFLMRPVFVKIGGGRGIGEISVSSRTFLGRLKLKAFRWLKPRFVAVTNDLVLEFREYGLGLDIRVIPNGVDTQRFQPVSAEKKSELRRSWKWPERAFCLLYVGRLSPEKQLEVLIRGFSEILREIGSEMCLILAGAGPESTRLEREVKEANLEEYVRFQAPVESVEKLYQAADAFALPSISEGLSNALLEAMSCGLPVLASRVGGTAEAVQNEVSGMLFDPQDFDGMKKGLKRLAQSPQDAQAMGHHARDKVKADFDLQRVAEQYLNLYSS